MAWIQVPRIATNRSMVGDATHAERPTVVGALMSSQWEVARLSESSSLVEALEGAAALGTVFRSPSGDWRAEDLVVQGLGWAEELPKTLHRGARVILALDNEPLGLSSLVAVWSRNLVPVVCEPNASPQRLERLRAMFGSEICASVQNGNFVWETTPIPQATRALAERFVDLDPVDLAVIFMTSGSTGYQKGVMITWGGLAAALTALLGYLPYGVPGTQVVSALRFDFDYGFYQPLLALLGGSTSVVQLPTLVSLRSSLREASESTGGQLILPIVPSFTRALATWPACPTADPVVVTTTGSPLHEGHLALLDRFFRNPTVYSMYGLTECKRALYQDPTLIRRFPAYVGHPIPSLSAELAPFGNEQEFSGQHTPHELVIAGPTLAAGYWNEPDATDERFPVRNGRRVLRTGDMFDFDSEAGYRFLGRLDDIVKVRDQRVSLVEVESALRVLPIVEDASVGVVDGRLVALVVSNTGARAVRSQAKAQMEHRLIPDEVVVVKALPLSRRGKPRRPGARTDVQ